MHVDSVFRMCSLLRAASTRGVALLRRPRGAGRRSPAVPAGRNTSSERCYKITPGSPPISNPGNTVCSNTPRSNPNAPRIAQAA